MSYVPRRIQTAVLAMEWLDKGESPVMRIFADDGY
jgi:hypothetical protein